MAYASYSSYGNKPYEPIVIKPASAASSMDLQELQVYIRENPSVLEKKEEKEDAKDVKEDIKDSNKNKKRKVPNPVFFPIEKYESSDDESDDSDDTANNNKKYISKNEVEIEKLEETIRYLKLDLNNEQLKSDELNSVLKKERSMRLMYENALSYVTDYHKFMEKKPFYTDGRINYNAELIQMSKKYSDMEKEYHELLDKRKKCEEEYEKVYKEYEDETQELTFYSKYEKEIRKKYRELDDSYKKANDILTNQMKQSNSCLSYFFAILLFAIFERLFYISFLK